MTRNPSPSQSLSEPRPSPNLTRRDGRRNHYATLELARREREAPWLPEAGIAEAWWGLCWDTAHDDLRVDSRDELTRLRVGAVLAMWEA